MALVASRRRRLRRRERARRRRFLVGAVITLTLILGSVVRLSRLPSPRVTEAHTTASRGSELLAVPTAPVVEEGDRREPSTYPYSIIPGGALSAEALRRAIAADPVVRDHYANFDLAKVRVVRLTEQSVAYVSYRLEDHVYWTRRPLVLNAGETLLTDGLHYARTRCGNQLSATPGPVSAAEPSPEALDAPTPVPRSSRVFPSITLPTTPRGSGSIAVQGVPGTPLGGGGVSIGSPPFGPPPRTALTEPAPTPQFFGSSVGLTLPTQQIQDPPDFSEPHDPPFEHVPSGLAPDDPHTRQVPEPGLTHMMLAGGAVWARRRWKR